MLGARISFGEDSDNIFKCHLHLICQTVACEAPGAVPADLAGDEEQTAAGGHAVTETLRSRPMRGLQDLRRRALHGLPPSPRDFKSARAMMSFCTSVAPS